MPSLIGATRYTYSDDAMPLLLASYAHDADGCSRDDDQLRAEARAHAERVGGHA